MSLELESKTNHTSGSKALSSYPEFLEFLRQKGKARATDITRDPALPFLTDIPGLKQLFWSMSSVAPAVPDTHEEEWNPLSQRPHAPLIPPVGDELGAEVNTLKLAVEQYTILSHEIMHIALWEPFFAGLFCPAHAAQFAEFSLLAEGYCHFFADIEVSGAIRVLLPDGEFALERQTPSSALFAPIRAFHKFRDHSLSHILDMYLEGFRGSPTALWQASEPLASALAAQAFDFYRGSLPLLDHLYPTLNKLGVFKEFFKRFCQGQGDLTFLPNELAKRLSPGHDPKSYFLAFFTHALPALASLSEDQVSALAFRRMLQTRAYYAMQVRWLNKERLLVSSVPLGRMPSSLEAPIDRYLNEVEGLLRHLNRETPSTLRPRLAELDERYSREVRRPFLEKDVWVAQRWFIAPHRAGGQISVLADAKVKAPKQKAQLLGLSQFFLEELTPLLDQVQGPKAKGELLSLIAEIAALGAEANGRSEQQRSKAWRKCLGLAKSKALLPYWSLPMASFHPEENHFRELAFSYQ